MTILLPLTVVTGAVGVEGAEPASTESSYDGSEDPYEFLA
jgi:hypothetical protein